MNPAQKTNGEGRSIMDFKCKCDLPGHCAWRHVITTKESYEACKQGRALHDNDQARPAPCAYLGNEIDSRRLGTDVPLYACHQLGECTLQFRDPAVSACSRCSLYMDARKLDYTKWKDPLLVTTSDGNRTTSVRNFLKGGAAFLVCGGPSLRQVAFERLRERGIFSLGVNNVAGFAPCSAFVCSDPPSKFHSSIFYDPKIMKFLPTPKLKKNRGRLRKKIGRVFVETKDITADCPNTYGFERRSWLSCDETWFTEPSAAWGNHNAGVEKTGNEKTVNTMFLGLRVLQYLGARTIFILGCDFFMNPADTSYSFGDGKEEGIDRTQTYSQAFRDSALSANEEERKRLNVSEEQISYWSRCRSNNSQYRIANDWFKNLRPVFEQFGFKTYNCFRYSKLTAFDYVPFDVALEIVRGKVECEPFDLNGWYQK